MGSLQSTTVCRYVCIRILTSGLYAADVCLRIPLSADTTVCAYLGNGCIHGCIHGYSCHHEAPGDELHVINDDHEYQFNTQVDDELEMYMQDEGIDSVESGERMKDGAVNAVATDSFVKDDKRQTTCPGRKRRIITVTQWDASARKQMVKQLGQHGVT